MGPVPAIPPIYDPRLSHGSTRGSSLVRAPNDQLPCFRWPVRPLATGVVSVTRLEAPEPAKNELRKACEAVLKHKLPEAEQHLSQAVALYPKYAVAWALLGQVQEDRGRPQEAEISCGHGRDADSTYTGSYLCLAHLALLADNWAEVAKLTDQTLDLHPIRAPGAFYYNALAYLYLKQEAPAEKSALRVAEDPEFGKASPIHLLLAKIYELKGDRGAEANELRVYLKLAPHEHDSDIARKILQQIEDPATRSGQPKPSNQNK